MGLKFAQGREGAVEFQCLGKLKVAGSESREAQMLEFQAAFEGGKAWCVYVNY